MTAEENTTAQLFVKDVPCRRSATWIYGSPPPPPAFCPPKGNQREPGAGLQQQQGSPGTRHNRCSHREPSPILKSHWSHWKFSLTKHCPVTAQTPFQSSPNEPPTSGNCQPHRKEMGRGTGWGATYFPKGRGQPGRTPPARPGQTRRTR